MTCDTAMQVKLLCALAGDREFFRQNIGKLRLSDFPSPSVRVVFEVMRQHWERYDEIPNGRILPDEVGNALRGIGPDGKDSISTSVPESMVRQTAGCIGDVIRAMASGDRSGTAYFRDRLREYLSTVRLAELPGEELTASEQLERAAEIKAEVDSITGGERAGLAKSARTRIVRKKQAQPKRFGTGVWPIDIRMGMGLELGEAGCVCGGTGSGKSNMLINFTANAAMRGQHALFITLELSDEVVLRRMHAMFGNFPMSLMNKPEEDWDRASLDRYNYMLSDAFPNIDYVTVNYEYVSRPPTCEDLDREIGRWKADMHAKGVADDGCPLVCVDYIRQIDPGKLVGRNDNTNTKFGAIMQELKHIAARHRVVLWTAQQVTRAANNKEHLRKDDIADSIAILNHCDACLGFVPVGGAQQSSPTTMETEDDTADRHADKERRLNVDFIKLRNSGETGTFCTVFQGKSLRLWTSESYERVVASMTSGASAIGFERFFAAMRPKEASR